MGKLTEKLKIKNTDGVEENTIKIEVWYGCEGSQKDGAWTFSSSYLRLRIKYIVGKAHVHTQKCLHMTICRYMYYINIIKQHTALKNMLAFTDHKVKCGM